ncbi:hypothetical protein NPIL_524431, partial [Nephila pilipes]
RERSRVILSSLGAASCQNNQSCGCFKDLCQDYDNLHIPGEDVFCEKLQQWLESQSLGPVMKGEEDSHPKTQDYTAQITSR